MIDRSLIVPTTNDPRWPRIVARDHAADGAFWYSVATTGVYCRPSCPSRTANPANVAIHATLADARATGCRPCRRCDPDGDPVGARDVTLVEAACRRIEGSETPLTLAMLAAAAGRSPAHFHRVFKRIAGVTPRDYAAAVRAARVRADLAGPGTVTAAIHAAGFGSSGRFYAQSDALLGMTPGRYKDGGTDETLRVAIGRSALGAVLVAASTRGIAAILIGDDADTLRQDLQDRFPRAWLIDGDAAFGRTVAQVVALVEAPGTTPDLPLDIRGTAFQQRVWSALRAIPPGTTTTYAGIARAIGAPAATRAVAGACAANALAVAIPCHRVVRGDGSLSGYRWGVARKRRLLDLEGGRET